MTSVFGVDVSMHQAARQPNGTYRNVIDWRRARDNSGVRWAYVKISEGVQYIDPAADAILAAIAEAGGILSGGYHYARPDTNAPEQDAEDFGHALLARNLANQDHLPPCLDMEQEKGIPAGFDMVSWTQRCIARLRAVTGYQLVMIYANTNWWRNWLGGGGWLDENTFAWVADYGPPPGQPGWKGARAVAHQYGSDGTIDGYGGRIDVNTAWVDLGSLATGGVPLPKPPAGGGGGTGSIFRPGGFPLPPNTYYGFWKGPNESKGGHRDYATADEIEQVRQIQLALCRLGFARRNNGDPVTDPNGWSDGLYGEATVAAMKRAQAAWGYHQTGNVWPDDWDMLFA